MDFKKLNSNKGQSEIFTVLALVAVSLALIMFFFFPQISAFMTDAWSRINNFSTSLWNELFTQ